MNESNISDFYREMGISGQVYHFGQKILEELEGRFKKIDETAEYNQMKVLKALQENKVSEACLLGTTGSGRGYRYPSIQGVSEGVWDQLSAGGPAAGRRI